MKFSGLWQASAVFLLLSISAGATVGQIPISATSLKTRILFVLDASGSMKGTWKEQSKFEAAKEILAQTVDSISKSNTNIEFALRVMGHQSPRAANNCTDTKLEVPFAKGNGTVIREALFAVTPQGQTPITYSLQQSLNDFGNDTVSINAVILITDGEETCGGDICDLAKEFEKRRIALKPYIVGLGLSEEKKKQYDCLGTFFDVADEAALGGILNVVISKVLNRTSCQINLLDAYGKPTITNIELTLYDHSSGKVQYNFIHTMNAKGNPDTLFLDPKRVYDLTVHCIPSLTKENIEIVPGIHNTIAMDVPTGTLDLKLENASTAFSNVLCLVRESGSTAILNVQDFNTTQRYLAGNYDLEILTLPEVKLTDVNINQGEVALIKIPVFGTLTVTPSEPGVASVFTNDGNGFNKVYDFYKISVVRSVNLQPGKYVVIFRPEKGKQSAKTKQIAVTVASTKTISIKL